MECRGVASAAVQDDRNDDCWKLVRREGNQNVVLRWIIQE